MSKSEAKTAATATAACVTRIGLRDYQMATLNLKSTIKALVGGMGSGKTRTLCTRAIQFCMENPGLRGGMVSPTYPMAHRTILPMMTSLLREWKIPYEYSRGFREFCINGTIIDVVSGIRPNDIKGPNWGWAGIDEPFLQHKDVLLNTQTRLRVMNPMLELLLTGTPEQLNWGYEILEGNRQPNTAYIRVSSRAFLPPAVLASIIANNTSEAVQAYIDGKFVLIGRKSAYYTFSDANVRRLSYNPLLPLVLTCDFNKAPMSWNILQEPPSILRVGSFTSPYHDTCVLDELHIEGTNTYEACDEFIRRYHPITGAVCKHKGLIQVTGDYSGKSTEGTVATLSCFEVIVTKLKKVWGSSNVQLQITPNPLQSARINTTCREFLNAEGERHCHIDPKCRYTINDYRYAVLKSGTFTLAKDEYDPHHSDAVDYRIWYKLTELGGDFTSRGAA